MLKTTLSILLSCICMAFLLCACEPAENYELAFKQKYIDKHFTSNNYQDENTVKELFHKADYPQQFEITTGGHICAVSVFPTDNSVTPPSPAPPPLDGSVAEKIIDKTGKPVTMNRMIIGLLADMYETKPTGAIWDSPSPTNDNLTDAMLRTIMAEPQITPRIQRDVQTHLRFKGVLISGSDVILSSIETSGGVYCLGDLFLANGSKIITDSKYIGDCKIMYNASDLMQRIQAGYNNKFPMNMDAIPKRTQVFRYMEVNLEGYRNSTFEEIKNDLNSQDFETILKKR